MSDLDRRRFLMVAAGAAAASTLPGCASLVARPVTPVEGKIRLPFRDHPELARPGGYLKVRVPGDAPALLYVFALGDGEFAALSPICTHLGCTVNIDGAALLCPCHGSIYDRSGLVLRGPAPKPLTRFAASLSRDDELVIDLASAS